MSGKFTIIYSVDDGYVGNGKQSFTIKHWDIEDDMTEDDLDRLYDDLIQEDFEQRVSPVGKNRDEFIEWGKGQIAKRGGE